MYLEYLTVYNIRGCHFATYPQMFFSRTSGGRKTEELANSGSPGKRPLNE